MRLYIDLSPTEEANIHGWVNKGLNDPAFANNPWRLVLEERTRARFDQIAGQFAPPVVVPPGEIPHEPHDEIQYGDFGRKLFQGSKAKPDSFPFRTPTGPFVGGNGGLLRMSVSENPGVGGGSTWLRKLAISTIAGDMVGLLPPNQGKEATLMPIVGLDIPAGVLLYANTIITEDAPEGTTGSGFSILWPQV